MPGMFYVCYQQIWECKLAEKPPTAELLCFSAAIGSTSTATWCSPFWPWAVLTNDWLCAHTYTVSCELQLSIYPLKHCQCVVQSSAMLTICSIIVLMSSSIATFHLHCTNSCHVCVPPVLCPEPESTPNGKYRYLNRATTPVVGSQLEYTCEGTHTLVGEMVLTCLNTGQWSAPTPTCEGK